MGDRTVLILLIKNPAGANEVVRTLVDGGPPRLLVVALNDDIADGRDVSWIWDVDFEPLLDGLERLVATRRARRRSSRCASSTAASTRSASRSCPRLERALDRGLELTPPAASSSSSPPTRPCSRCASIVAERGLVRPYWEGAAA